MNNSDNNLGCRRTVLMALLALLTIVAMLSFGTVAAPLGQLTTQTNITNGGK